MLPRLLALGLVVLAFVPGQPGAAEGAGDEGELFSAEGYRIARYRAPLPAGPPAGQRIGTAALAALIEREAPVLVDVQAVTVRPESEDFGIAWLPSAPRFHLPGSHWLPNVGYGRLDTRMRAYLEEGLARLTQGDRDRPVVFYCVVDCWMSWNAVKRAHALGYRNLYWYPEGTDGWEEAGLPLVAAQPEPLPPAGDCAPSGFFACVPPDLAGALRRVGAQERLAALLLFFETDDCQYCRRMRRGVLQDPRVIDAFRERFIALAVDLESDAALVGPDGEVTTPRRFAREASGVFSTPTLVFLDAGGGELYRHAGVIVDPAELLALGDYVAGGHYSSVGFTEFRAAWRPAPAAVR